MTEQTPVSEVVTLPASKIFVAPENPRANDSINEEDLNALAENIAVQGLLTPLLGYMDDGQFYAVAGGRRTRAIDILRNDGRLDPDAPIPVRIVDHEHATTIGIAEQVTHKNLTALDTLRIFSMEPYRSMPTDELAKIVGMKPRFVEQRKAILNLPDYIVNAALNGDITVDQAEGMVCYADLQEDLRGWLDRCKRDPSVTGRYIRDMYSREWVSWSKSKWTQLVSQEEYEAAGGKLEADLFGSEPRIISPEILHDLALAAVGPAVEAEHPGYAAYKQVENLWNAPQRHYGIEPEWSVEDTKRYAEITARQDELEGGTDEEWEAGEAEFEALDTERAALDEKYERTFPDELKAMLEVHYTVEQYGSAPYKAMPNVLPKDLEPLYEAGFMERPKAKETTPDGDQPQADDDALPAAMCERIKDIKRHVTQQELIKDPKRVLALYCEHLAQKYDAGFVVAPMYATGPDAALEFTESPQWTKAEQLAAAPSEDVAGMSHADHLKVMAYRILNCITKTHPVHAEADAKTIRKYWTPDEDFLKKYKKPHLLEMLTAVSNSADSNLKVSEMAALLADHAESDKSWLPHGF